MVLFPNQPCAVCFRSRNTRVLCFLAGLDTTLFSKNVGVPVARKLKTQASSGLGPSVAREIAHFSIGLEITF